MPIEAGGRQVRIGTGQRALHPGGQSLDRACRAHNPVRLNPHVHEREEMGIHLRGRNVHGLLGHERRDRVQTGGNGHISYLAHDQRIFVDVAAYGIGSAIEFSGEGLVHHGHVLRIGAVCFRKDAARKQRHFQCVEESRRDVEQICPILVAGLFAVAELDPIVNRALVREAQSDRSILHAGNLSHRSRALV